MNDSRIVIRRWLDEEPDLAHLAVTASNGSFGGWVDFYCNIEDLGLIGRSLESFPQKVGDGYRYESGSEDLANRSHSYFLLRAYTTDSVGHCALQIAMNNNTAEPQEGMCRFSITADAASINRLGSYLLKFEKLKHLELRWTPEETEIFQEYQ
jgi:hypothetical protein